MRRLHLGVAAATAALSLVLRVLHVPSPELFAGVVVGLVVALRRSERVDLPRGTGRAAQAVLGVSIGGLVTTATLRDIGGDALPVLGVCLGTLVLSLGAGLVLTRMTGVDAATGSFGMVAGGATGIVAIARELGADPRLVAVMQYLRVLVVVVTAPLLAQAYPTPRGAPSAGAGAPEVPGFPDWLVFVLACTALGLLLARVARLPAGSLLGPLIVSAAAAAAGLSIAGPLPDGVQAVAFAVIGLQVGVSFTVESLRQARDTLLPSLVVIVGLLVICAGLGALLSLATGVSAVDGYLATTPGGLYAVLAASIDSGGDAAFVLAVQVVRVFLMLLAAPLLARSLNGRASGRG